MIRVLLGLIFIGADVAVGIDVWQENSNHVVVQGFGHMFSQAPWVAIVVGAVCGALIMLGLAFLFAGAASRRRTAGERRAALRDLDRLLQQANEERAARQQAELEAERARSAAAEQTRLTGTTTEAPRLTGSSPEAARSEPPAGL